MVYVDPDEGGIKGTTTRKTFDRKKSTTIAFVQWNGGFHLQLSYPRVYNSNNPSDTSVLIRAREYDDTKRRKLYEAHLVKQKHTVD